MPLFRTRGDIPQCPVLSTYLLLILMQIYTVPVMLRVSEGGLISKHPLNPATACSMIRSALNSSSLPPSYFWKECNTYDKEAGGASLGILILFTTYILEFLIGTPLNIWLAYHILSKRSKVSGVLPADFFPLHLALVQVSFDLVVPVFFVNHFLWQSLSVYAMTIVVISMVVIMKPLLLCMVCVERYMAVVRPLNYLRFKARSYRWGCVGTAWCIYILMASAALFNPSTIALCCVFLPVLVIDTFCSASILRTLMRPPPGDTEMERKSEKPKQSREKERKDREVGKRRDQRGKQDMNSMKRTAFATVVLIQAVLMLNYIPFIVCLPLEEVISGLVYKCQFQAMALAAAVSVTYLQPLLYLHRLGRLPFMKPARA